MSTAERFTGNPRGAGAPSKWINAGPDEGALHALLDRMLERVPRERIDVLWVFPPRIAGGAESTVIVIAAFDTDPERRTVATAHFQVTRDRRGRATVTLEMQEHASAPVGATQRVVDGVLRRLGDEVGKEAPRREEIGGEEAAWRAFYVDVGGAEPEDNAAQLHDRAAQEDATAADGDRPPEQQPEEPGGAADVRSTEEMRPDEDPLQAEETAASDQPPLRDDTTETPPHGDPLSER